MHTHAHMYTARLRTCVHTHMHAHARTHDTRTCLHACIHTHVCAHACTRTLTHARTHACTHARTHRCMHATDEDADDARRHYKCSERGREPGVSGDVDIHQRDLWPLKQGMRPHCPTLTMPCDMRLRGRQSLTGPTRKPAGRLQAHTCVRARARVCMGPRAHSCT